MNKQAKKVYLASSFSLKERVEKIAEIIKSEGWKITREWWKKDYKKIDAPDEKWYQSDIVKKVSESNFRAIDEADVVILVAPEKKPIRFKGADVEVGYAYGKGKTIISIGKLLRSAMYVPIKKFKSIKKFKNRYYFSKE